MGPRQTYRDTLMYAIAIAGGELELARHLGVALPQLRMWLDGVDAIPDRIFFAAIDVVIGSSRDAIARSRELLNRVASPLPNRSIDHRGKRV